MRSYWTFQNSKVHVHERRVPLCCNDGEPPKESKQKGLTNTSWLALQVNARMGGGPVHLMNQLVWGVDLVEEQMLASAGIPSRPYISKRPNSFVAEYSVNAKHTGIIKNLDFLEVCSCSALPAFLMWHCILGKLGKKACSWAGTAVMPACSAGFA